MGPGDAAGTTGSRPIGRAGDPPADDVDDPGGGGRIVVRDLMLQLAKMTRRLRRVEVS
jgi:hypothetical protein